MGMFDYIVCKHPLPDGFDASKVEWQTKDTDSQYLDIYTITEDGRLLFGAWRDGKRSPDVPQPDFHGDIFFYGNDGGWNAPEGYYWREYRARFSEGKLLRIDLIECEHRTPSTKATAL
jgi:hypothetical protein